jgi:hypothetical protein
MISRLEHAFERERRFTADASTMEDAACGASDIEVAFVVSAPRRYRRVLQSSLKKLRAH